MNPEKAKRYIRSTNDYREDIARAKKELALIWYELSGVKGVSFDKIRGTDFNDLKKVEHFENREKDIRYWQKILDTAESNLVRVEAILIQLPADVREAVTRIYVNGETYDKVAADVHFSISGLYSRIERALIQVE